MNAITKRAIDNILGFLFSLTVFGMFTYLIFWRGWSEWWYLMALMFIVAFSPRMEKEEEEEKE